MNIYRHKFKATCPNNGQEIDYELEIQTYQMLPVESIVKQCAEFPTGYHEVIADGLFDWFGGKQILRAHHHGVDIETRRGFE